jgi:low affinity Fe/Cu permease
MGRAQQRGASVAGTERHAQRCGCMPWFIRRIFTLLGTTAASAWAFTVYALLWVIFDPGSFNWHAIATLAVWCMTLFIQRSEHRDTQAIHAKLDELLKAQPNASDRLSRIDEEEPEEIETYREAGKAAQDKPLLKKQGPPMPVRDTGPPFVD